jgi:TP901 family phage tail tape measure protein
MAIDLKAGIDHAAFVKDVERGMRKANAAMSKRGNTLKLKIDDKGFRQPLGRITGDLNMFDSALAASNARVIAFGASTAVIGGISKAFKELAKTTIVVAKQFADINRILSLSNKNFEKFGNKLFEISKKNATGFQDTTKAALEFARQGLKTEETLKRTSDALTLVRLTGINADKAVATLTATVNAFEGTMLTTTTAVNKFVAVETKFAVGARDLVEAIGRVGSSARDAKVGFDELNAMVTSVQQTTGRGGAVIGNAMKTIFTRLQRQSTLEALESYNVAVRDIQGNTLPAMQILDNFAQSYAGLADASQSYLREQVAGVFQANILSAILKDLNKQQSTYGSALDVSTKATNEANQATAELNRTLSALVDQTGLEFQRLQQNIGKATFEPIAKELLAPLKGLMKGINDLIDGEGAGSEVANGLLKGIRNVLGGPGLVAALGLIGKVFLNTTSYILKSLPALAGITTETQKRATLEKQVESILQRESGLALAIQGYTGNTAMQAQLLADYAQMAADDMDRQESSVANIAATLMRMPKGSLNVAAVTTGKAGKRGASGFIPGMAGEVHDIKRGVGGVSSSAKPVTIPNFAFGGGVRGTMIANTGEHIVPNFKGGGSAIFNPNMIAQYGMPAGAKPIRGAGGYVPNFVDVNKANAGQMASAAGITQSSHPSLFTKTGAIRVGALRSNLERKSGAKSSKGRFFDARQKAHMFVPQAGFKMENYPYVFGPNSSMQKMSSTVSKDGKPVDGMLLNAYGPSLTASKRVQKGGNLAKVEDILDDSLRIAAENVIMAYSPALHSGRPVNKKKVEGSFLKEGGAGAMGAFKGALFEAVVDRLVGQQYEKGKQNSSTLDILLSGKAGKNAEDLFGITGTAVNATHADAKSSWSSGNRTKITEQIMKNFGKSLPITMGAAARGYVPNFAALGDSVERELAAGVPMGSIRVGRSSRLAGPNNPAGLGVTNTRDEPRGLADVVGASRGYVPNYVDPMGVDVSGVVGKTNKQLAGLNNGFTRFQRILDKVALKLSKKEITETQAMRATQRLGSAAGKSGAALTTLQARVKTTSSAMAIAGKKPSSAGGGMGGMGGMAVGMGLSMGLPMAAGAMEQAGFSRDTTGAMNMAGTGAAIGMLAGPWGAAAGAAVGALGSLAVSSLRVGARMDELEAEFTEFEKTSKEQNSAAQNIIKAQEEINNPTSADALKAAQIALKDNFEKIKGTQLEKNFKAAGTNVDEMTVALKSFTSGVVAERTGRQTIRAANKFGFQDRVLGKGNNMMALTSDLNQPTTEEGILRKNKALTVAGYGKKTQTAFVDEFKDFFEILDFNAEEAKEISTIARGVKESPNDVYDLTRKFLELREDIFDDMFLDEKLFKSKPGEAKSNVFQRVASLFKGDAFVESLGDMENIMIGVMRAAAEAKAAEDASDKQYKLVKQLETSFTAINKDLDVSINAIKDTPIAKFKDAFKTLNSALSKIGSDIRNVVGDQVGATRFRADATNRQRVLDNRATRQKFGITQQKSLRTAFDKAFPQGSAELGAYEDISKTLLTNPAKATQMLKLTTGPRPSAPGIAGELQRRAAPNMGVFAKSGTELPKAQDFRNAAAALIRAYEIQEANIAAQGTVISAEQKIEEIKAKNLVQERDLQKAQKLSLSERENLNKLEQMRLQQEISMMQKRSQDPAASRGLTNRQNTARLFADQRAVLQKQILMDEARVKADNVNLKMEFEMQKTLIQSNLALIGADEKLIEATEKLGAIIIGEGLGKEFDKGGEMRVTGAAAALAGGASNSDIRQMYIDQNLKKMGFTGIGSSGGSAAVGGAGGSGSAQGAIQKEINQLEQQYNQDVEGNNDQLLKRIEYLKEQLNLDEKIGNREAKRNTEFSAGLQDGFNKVFQDTDSIFNKLGKDLPTAFKDGMVGAMESAMDKADSFGDAMRGVAIDMLKMMRRAALESSMSNLTSLMGMGISPGFRNSGLQNGAFVPGSGTGDKVPSLLEPGEYVMNRKAVKGIGRANLDKMNFGAFPRFANGGSMGLDESVHSSRMSGYFLASDNPELAEAREAERERLAKEAEKKAQKKQLLSTFLSTVASMGVGKLMGMAAGKFGAKNPATVGGPGDKTMHRNIGSGGAFYSESAVAGRPETAFDSWKGWGPGNARGGHIGSGFTNRDSVPAYMAGGEFVMNNRAVRKYGLGFMGRLNGGVIPTMQAGGGVDAAPLNAQSGANTNNISINVSMGGSGGGGQGASESAGNANASEQSNVDQATKGKEMAERIRAAVLEVIGQEQRLGGSLSKKSRTP